MASDVGVVKLRLRVDLEFLERGDNALLLGGETAMRCRIGHAVANELLDAGHALLTVDAGDLGVRLKESAQKGRLAGEIRQLDKLDLLVILDLDEVDPSSEEGGLLAQLLAHRRQHRRSILGTAEAVGPDGDAFGRFWTESEGFAVVAD